MAQAKSSYVCQSCGGQTAKWSGQCPACGDWNTLSEFAMPAKGRSRQSWSGAVSGESKVHSPDEVSLEAQTRAQSGIGEFDRVLGGGLVPGSVVLLGGDPGIGKSTLLLQALTGLAGQGVAPGLYVTGEESLSQVMGRAQRLGLPIEGLRLLAETRLEQVLGLVEREQPKLLIIDSVQTLYTDTLESAPGGVAQVRECAAQLVRYAKRTGTGLFLVGHVTKEGSLAGPRVLEHMVDTVLYFESEETSRYRIVRAVKNRFGTANELGLFAMTERGLREVSNPSAIFLTRHDQDVAGSTVMVTREGTRPLLLEVQALVDDSTLATPRRVCVGFEPNRLAMLLAVMHRHAGVSSHGQDVFLNVVGGVRVSETGADLPVVLSVLSSLKDRPLLRRTVVFGEIGLGGEVRPVPNGEERLREAAKHGFERAIVPAGNAPRKAPGDIQVIAINKLDEVFNHLH
tara:strand:- start:191 stop:1558 length:1368 start_codon:yes stop_codon:yes gene_type:complete